MEMINISNSALDKLYEMLQAEENKTLYLRMFVAGGGCAGLQYGFTFDDKTFSDDTIVIKNLMQENKKITLIVDPISIQYLATAIVDFKKDSGQFSIHNPNISATCCCGGR